MKIKYEINSQITANQFVDVLKRSTLAERRPVDNPVAIQAMLDHGNLLCTAWDDDKLVGVSRSITDFEFCCYLSDLAVDESYQRQGIGKELMRLTQANLGKHAKLILLAAPKAREYYPDAGFSAHGSAWVIDSTTTIK